MIQGTKEIGPIVFSDMSGGLATALPPHAIENNQVSDALNAVFEMGGGGVSRAPGLTGLSASPVFSAPVRGHFKYTLSTGAEVILAVSGFRLYSVDASTGALTQLHVMQSDAECFGVNYFGKFWIVNGTDMIKVEEDLSVYRIGISQPVGITIEILSGVGATLPAGAYTAYASFTRKISGTTVLHSSPVLLGSVTISSGDGIRVRFDSAETYASIDPQAEYVTVWMTTAGGVDYYWYAESLQSLGTVSITSDTRNQDLLMIEMAASNQLPQNLKTIYASAGRLFGTVNGDNDIFYSYYAQNVYDLERWPTEYHIPTIPFIALSLFSVGNDLFVNTIRGLYKFQNSDLTSKPEPVIQGAGNNCILYFPENMLKTIQEYNNLVYGVTNDGFRSFDGTSFSIDLSKHIKPQIDKVVNGLGDYNPYGVVLRRPGKRTEYQLSFKDDSLSTDCHNRTLVLNLDSMVIIDNQHYTAAWELWSHGYGGAIVTESNQMIVAQWSTFQGTVALEAGKSIMNCLDDQGVFVTTITPKRIYTKGKIKISELAGKDRWQRVYFLANLDDDCTIKLLIADEDNYRSSLTVGRVVKNHPVLDVVGDPLILPFVLNANNSINGFEKLPMSAKGNTVTLEIDQTADDENFLISRLELYGTHERNIFT